jgi:hypothetical protein
MIMKQFIFSALVAFIILTICSSFLYGFFCRKEGIEGYVYEVKGNQMPSPDIKRSPPKGIKTTVYVYELTGPDQVTKHERAGFYSAIHSKLVKKVETNEKGYFKVKLSPGKYSLFTRVDSLFYANLFDQDNRIFPVEVLRKKRTEVVIKQDFKAAY